MIGSYTGYYTYTIKVIIVLFSIFLMAIGHVYSNIGKFHSLIDSTPRVITETELTKIVQQLKVYSYSVLTLDDRKYITGGGTGFFLRDEDKLYFITCKHVAWNKGVKYLEISLNKNDWHEIDLSEYPKDSFDWANQPDVDVSVFKVDNNLNVFDVSKYTYVNINYFAADKYIVWGYYLKDEKNPKRGLIFDSAIGNKIDEDSTIRYMLTKSHANMQVTMDKAIEMWKANNLIVPVNLTHGYSGAPVWGLYGSKIQLLGIYYGGEPITNLSIGNNVMTLIRYWYNYQKQISPTKSK